MKLPDVKIDSIYIRNMILIDANEVAGSPYITMSSILFTRRRNINIIYTNEEYMSLFTKKFGQLIAE